MWTKRSFVRFIIEDKPTGNVWLREIVQPSQQYVAPCVRAREVWEYSLSARFQKHINLFITIVTNLIVQENKSLFKNKMSVFCFYEYRFPDNSNVFFFQIWKHKQQDFVSAEMVSSKTIWNLFLFFGGIRGHNLFPMYGKIKCPKLPLFSLFSLFFFIEEKVLLFYWRKGFSFLSKKRILFFYWGTGFFLLKKGFSFPRNELLLYKKYFQMQILLCVSTSKKKFSRNQFTIHTYMFQRILNHKKFHRWKFFVKFYRRSKQDPLLKNDIIIFLLKYLQCHHYDIRKFWSFTQALN